MKLNLKKCSFGVEEGKFLRYMVTSEGIRANPKEAKAIADMQSPQTLREMKSLSGKLAVLNSSRGGRERGIANGKEGKQCLIRYVSRMLNEAENNYVALEKLALSLLHIQGGCEGKLAKYSVELGMYNITYEPRNAIKGQVLSDFLSEALVGTLPKEFFRLPARVQNKDDSERWTLFTNGASNSKGSGAGLVLISPSGTEFTYALRLNFTSTNNEAEYEDLLAGLYMAAKMKVQDIDSKRRRRQLDDSYHTVSGRGDMAGEEGRNKGPKNENQPIHPLGRHPFQKRILGTYVKVCGSLAV
ncbi:reverse transcriptase domain-containing protein [Tanacetum coccineum]